MKENTKKNLKSVAIIASPFVVIGGLVVGSILYDRHRVRNIQIPTMPKKENTITLSDTAMANLDTIRANILSGGLVKQK